MRRPPRKRRQNWMAKTDRLFSAYIRNRDGQCQAAGRDNITCAGNLQCCHIIGRGYKAVRVDPDNAIAMCQGHHVYYTHRPIEWLIFVEDLFPGRYERLRAKALSYARVDWKRAHAELKGML